MKNDFTDYEDLRAEVLSDRSARVAALENRIRRAFAQYCEDGLESRHLSLREFARTLDTSLSQVQRLLHRQAGGSLTLNTMCRAADALGLVMSIHLRPTVSGADAVIPMGRDLHWGSQAVDVSDGSASSARTRSNVFSMQHLAWQSELGRESGFSDDPQKSARA